MQQTTTKIPIGYKQTEVGVIPEDWKVKKLGDCLTRPPRYGIGAAAVEYSDRLPKYIRITDISEAGRLIPDKIVSVDNLFSANYFLSEGDLVVARTGASVGKSYLYRPEDGPLVFAGFLICISSNKNILLPQYLGNYFKTTSFWNWVKLTSMRSGQPGINGNEYARLLIPLPKIAEQTAIATVLSDTDALIERLEKLIAKKKAIKQGMMQKLLTGKKRLPGFSGDWEVKKLGEIVDFSNGKAHENFISDDGEYIVVNSKFISSKGQVIKYSKQCFSPAPANSILLVMSDVPNGKAIAKCFFVDKNSKYTVNQRICALNPKINAKFLFYKINRNPYYLSFDDGVKQTNLRKNDVLGCKLSIPKEELEQTAIATILCDMDADIESLEQKRDKYIMLKQGMMQELLTGKTRLI